MKRTYIAPYVETEQTMAKDDLLLAISAVGGDTGVDLGGEDAIPTEGDTREDLIDLNWSADDITL